MQLSVVTRYAQASFRRDIAGLRHDDQSAFEIVVKVSSGDDGYKQDFCGNHFGSIFGLTQEILADIV
jgi:hypothetical protein